MEPHKIPKLEKELFNRIRLVRRDISDLLFHFTRAPEEKFVTVKFDTGHTLSMSGSTSSVLRKILYEGKLTGTSKWTYGENCVCFTEAPIQEFNSIFSLVEIASSKKERPRYEPYGIAVNKKWLFEQGGRPVVYDHPDTFTNYPDELKYRFVPYDPAHSIDYSWEREWRIKTDSLTLDPNHTLVIVPSSEEAFNIVYEFAKVEPDWDYDGEGGGQIVGVYHLPKWLAVSLDLFGFNYQENNKET